jgi:putative hydrolase of the HAD superfamily
VIEAVTFDFWNTIAQVPPGSMPAVRRRAVAAACEEGGCEVDPDLLASGLDEVRLRWERSWAEGVHLHPREGAAMLVEALGLEEAAGAPVAEAFLGAGREVEMEFAPDLGPALERLQGRGVRLGIVCDVGFSGGALLRELLDREGLLVHFDGWSFSDETGTYKPAPGAFEAALAALRVAPAEALHVGDLRRTDVVGAAALGMRTVRYRGMQDDDDGGDVEAEFGSTATPSCWRWSTASAGSAAEGIDRQLLRGTLGAEATVLRPYGGEVEFQQRPVGDEDLTRLHALAGAGAQREPTSPSLPKVGRAVTPSLPTETERLRFRAVTMDDAANVASAGVAERLG